MSNTHTEEFFQAVEKEIETYKTEFDFDIREYPLEFLQTKFNPSAEDGEPDLYIPDYQRGFVWTPKQQSLFIESLLIGLPVPYIFCADICEEEEDSGDGRIEIVDGAQRVQTIDAFLTNTLTLTGLEKLKLLNKKTYQDLSPARKRRFNRTTIRMIELSNINEDGRRLMFDRLNTGGTKLSDMEKRRGVDKNKFMLIVDDIAQDTLIKKMTPLPKIKEDRREREEYILRFFAYLNSYQKFKSSVQKFLKDYIKSTESDTADLEKKYKEEILQTFNFVNKHFKEGFKKNINVSIVSRVRFEAVSVGVALALREKPELLKRTSIDTSWAFNEAFTTMIRSDASNSRPKVVMRIEYARDAMLKQV